MKCVFKYQDLQIFGHKLSNFDPLDVVGRGSETQRQVDENFNKIALLVIANVRFESISTDVYFFRFIVKRVSTIAGKCQAEMK